MMIMKNVVILTPPAVERGEPPINIKTQQIIFPGKEISFCGYIVSPIVRQLMAWNNASYKVKEPFPLKPSVKNNPPVPKTIKAPVETKAILVNDDHNLGGL